jgi:hypothetical protein
MRGLDAIAGTPGAWAKHEAKVVCGMDEGTNGDAGAACGTGEDAGVTCNTSGNVGVTWSVGGGIGATRGMGGNTGATCGGGGATRGTGGGTGVVPEEAKGKDDSSKMMCQETNMRFVVRSRHRYPLCLEEDPRKTH